MEELTNRTAASNQATDDAAGYRSADQGRGRRLREGLEALIAVSAFFVSLASIVIAYQESRASKQLVQASSLPWLSLEDTFNRSIVDGKAFTAGVALAVENNGVGPADVRYATMRYKGRNYGDSALLLRDCCGITQVQRTATLTNQMIRPGSQQLFLDVRGQASDRTGMDRYAQLLLTTKIETIICYCSVFNDCWLLKSGGITRPAPVKECPIVAPNEATL